MRLETFPKAAFRQHGEEVDYYEFVYSKIVRWIRVDDALVEEAIELGRRYDVVNLDALHAAAAIRAGADRFITTERPGKPFYRLTEIEVVYLLEL